uniref:Neuregulin C-terminal domain-containing protein n=1 Tax=Xiphophorus couchianus TaxID=32473 RepID=A0A3B5MGG5_9TELE
AGFTGHRCEQAVLKKVSDPKPEELYQKRILTITGICIALLVVGIMCVVAYCKTNKQRKKLRERLRQSQKKKRKNNSNPVVGSCTDGSPCNGSMRQLVTEETEITFPTSKYATANQPTTLTNISSQSEDWSNNVLSDTESYSVMSLVENSQRATQGVRGRLNATSGTTDLSSNSDIGYKHTLQLVQTHSKRTKINLMFRSIVCESKLFLYPVSRVCSCHYA